MSPQDAPKLMPVPLAQPEPLVLTATETLALAKRALFIRRTEERLLALFKDGKIFGTVHTCLGQEFTGVAVARALSDGDFIFSNHRCHGHYLARTDDAEGLIAEVMGKENGTSGGRGGSQHLCKSGFYSNGVQGGIAPLAAGMAMARKLAGEGRIGVVFVGDGTLGEGTLYEALNIVAKWELPLLVLLENNRYAQSTAQAETLAGDIIMRAQSFGIACAGGDTWQWQALMGTVQRAVDRVRTTGQPMFLRVDTYRLGPHSKGDDNRDPDEIAEAWKKDPLRQLIDEGEFAEALRGEDERIRARLDLAVQHADGAEAQSADVLHARVTAPQEEWQPVAFKEERVVASVRRALERAMDLDPRVVLIGEDIRSPYGGAFKATAGLSDRFSSRVINTPISEAAIVGVGTGLALEGYRPVVEIMFGDFVLLAADQLINHAAKLRWMYNDQVRVPLVVRTPMGGKRGYGPTHSQTLEKHLLGVPDLRVVALHPRYSPARVYEQLFESIDGPTLMIENKIMYGQLASPKVPPGFVLEANAALFPTVRVRPNLAEPSAHTDLTIVAYGGMVLEAEEALRRLFVEHDLAAELIIPLQLHPFDPGSVIAALRRSGKLLVVEEGQGFCGFGAELIAQLMERGALDGVKARRLTAAPCPIPTSRPLETAALPSLEMIERAALELVGG
jgi:2-oxoisovalerate dehydrogenase E1 component